MSEALQISPLADAPAEQPAVGAGCRACREPGALHQPRDLVAGVQPARPRGIGEPEPSAARAAALPVDLRQEPRRVRHGARCRPRWPGARADRHGQRRWACRRPSSLRAIDAKVGELVQQQHATWKTLRGELDEGRDRDRRAGHAERGRARLARELLPRFDLPGADAARHRPGAPVSRSFPISASRSPCSSPARRAGRCRRWSAFRVSVERFIPIPVEAERPAAPASCCWRMRSASSSRASSPATR